MLAIIVTTSLALFIVTLLLLFVPFKAFSPLFPRLIVPFTAVNLSSIKLVILAPTESATVIAFPLALENVV